MDTKINYESNEEEDILIMDALGNLSYLIIYNDDYNTFDWVIKCLQEVCQHTSEQAEQCSMIIHYKGKAIVKTAALEVLRPMKDALVERGLSAVIESEVESK
jgi:ATP-dependent Clp protease adaptor protein ClpS